ncbi:MAG: HAMP domain-containing protein [Ignavibacteriae bacterium]|nr:HAMP domain-containing protein [Ignavibacteriota bacterium]
MFSNLKLKQKFIFYFLIVGIIPLVFTSILLVNSANDSMHKSSFDQLDMVKTIKKNQIIDFFDKSIADAKVFAGLPFIKNAVRNLDSLSKIAKSNGHMGKDLLNYEPFKFEFEKYFDFVKNYQEKYGFYDVFLLSPNSGRVLLTVALEDDFGTELHSESHDLALAWQQMKNTKSTILTDMKPYAISNNAPAIFIVEPAYYKGEYVGSIALQLSNDKINSIMQERTGMGKTGETYLVGMDKLMRSDSFLDPENHSVNASLNGNVKENGIDTKATNDLIKGKEGEEIIIDYNGNPVLSAYSPISLPNNLTWGIIAEIDESEAFAAESEMITYATIISIVMVFLVGLLGFFVASKISKPISDVASAAKQISLGDVNVEIKHKSNDEIGELANRFNQLVASQKDKIFAAKEIADGNFKHVELASEKDDLSIAFNTEVDTINNLLEELKGLINNAKNGQLKTRADASKFNGAWKDLVLGVNSILDEIIKPIQEGSDVLKIIANGDLTVRVEGNYKGDHQIIKNSINSLSDSFNTLLNQLTEAIHATASAATQISSSTEEMAAGAEEQSSQTTEVATAMEQMAATITETTRNIVKTNDAAKESKNLATNGQVVIESTIKGMKNIESVVKQASDIITKLGDSSEQIGQIVQVINDIADQTNLLALNAAIEAARAGEHGRGFAVVADEVKKLAERTTVATNEIADMVNKIQADSSNAVDAIKKGNNEVSNGMSEAMKAGQSMSEIVKSSDKVLEISSQVAVTSEEQSATVEQISRSVESINAVSQESALGIQQVAGATNDLNQLTENLQNMVGKFKLHSENNSNCVYSQKSKQVITT